MTAGGKGFPRPNLVEGNIPKPPYRSGGRTCYEIGEEGRNSASALPKKRKERDDS